MAIRIQYLSTVCNTCQSYTILINLTQFLSTRFGVQEVAERGPESFSRNLPQLQAICMKGLKDPDAGVRQAALQAVDGLHGV